MHDNGGPAVLAEGLVKHFTGREGDVEAVRGVDLEVRAGEIFGFLGPNGAGKSTTVRMLTTLLTITSGRAEVVGVDVARDPDEARRRIGVALQEAGLDPRQTGRELLVLHGRLFGLGAAQAAERAQELLVARRAGGRRRPGDQGLLRRHAAPAGPRGGSGPRARGAVPGRADDGARSGQPADDLGGAAPDQRARDDGVPHHAVPRGGRPALRPHRDHRQRPHRAARELRGSSRRTSGSAGAATKNRRSTTSSSTRRDGPASARPARYRR